MAQGAFEGGVVSIRGDASQVKNELLEVSKLLTELEKNKVKLKPEIDINNVKKDVNKLEQYMQGKFGALDFSQVYSRLMTQVQKNPNKFAEELAKTMRGVNLLEQAVKPEDISKLAAASAQEMFDLVQRLGGLAEGTKPTSNLVTKRLKEIYDKYPNGIEGLGGSGKGNGFGASEEALNRIGNTLERIDANVQGITDSIRNGTGILKDASQNAEEYAGSMEKAETAANKMQTAVDKMKQRQQNVKKALEGEKVETDWDWTLSYLNEAKDSTSKKVSKPKTRTSESQPEIKASTPDVTPIKKVVKAEEELRNAAEGATGALREQNDALQNNNASVSSTNKKGLTFTKAVEQIGAPKEIAKYLKDPKSIKTILKGLDDDSLKGLDIDQILTNFSNDDDAKLNKALNDKMRRAAMYVQQIAAMFPDDWEDMFSGFSIFSQGVMGNWADDIAAFFEQTNDLVNGATGDIDDSRVEGLKITYDKLVEIMQEWADLYNTARPMLDKGMSKTDIDTRLDLMSGFTEEDVKNSELGTSGTVDLYSQKIEQTQQRLDQMAELKSLLDQEEAAGRVLSDRELIFLNNYQEYVNKGNAIIQNATTRKTALENPEAVREVARQKVEQRQQESQINFEQETLEAAKAQEELAKSVREANNALKEQNDASKDNIMYHMGNLSASKTKEISHPFGDEFKAWFEGIYDSGRGWGDGTGLYMTRDRDEYAPEIDQKSLENFYAIDTSGLNLYEAHAEEAAQDFYNFIHHIEQLCLQIGTGTEKFDDNLKNVDSESLYADFQRVFPNIQLSFEQFDDFITNMSTMLADSGLNENGIVDAQKLNAFKQKFGNDDIKTRFLKMLGYQGTDLSGTSFGGLQSGNVIFDPLDKSRIVAQGKNIDEVAAQAEKIKKIKQETVEALKTSNLEEENGIVELPEDIVSDVSIEERIAHLDQYIESLQERITWLKERQADLNSLINDNSYLSDADRETFRGTLSDIEKTIPKKEARLQKYVTEREKLTNPIDESKEAVDETKQNAEEAKKNADDAQKSAEAGKKAVEEAKNNKKKADAIISTSESASDLQPAVENAGQAEADTKKQVMYVDHSFDTLNNYLRQYTQELAQKKQERDTLLQKIQSIQNGTFDTSKMMPGASTTFDSAIEASGQSKEDYLRGMLEYDTQQLDVIEQQIINKQAQVLRVNKEHAEVEELVKQGFDVQEKQKPVKKNKKGVIITQVKDEIKAEQQDIEEAKQIIAEEKQEAERLAQEKKAKDDALRQAIEDTGDSAKGHKKGSEFKFGASLEGGQTAREKQAKGVKIKSGNIPNYTPPYAGTNGGTSSGAQQVKVVYQVETTLEDVKDANKQLKALKKTNTELTTSANQAADAIQKEAEALSKMAETLTTIGEIGSKVATANQEVKDVTTKAVNQTLTPEQPQAPTKPVTKPSVKPKATATKTSDEIKKTKEQIEQLQKTKEDAERNLKTITLDDSLFDVGEKYQKRNAYTQVKQWADDLKKAQEEVNSLGKNADPQKAYDKMRIGFSKAFEKALNTGTPQNVEKQMEAFEEQYFNLGRPSDDFKQVEERFTQASTQAAERAKAQFEQQKQQAEVIMARLQARLEELQAKEKAAPSSPVKPPTEPKPSKPVEEKPDLGGNQTGNGIKNEGDEAANATAKMKELAAAKKEVTEANQKLAQSAQNTTGALNDEGGAGANVGKTFDPKPLQQEIDALKQVSEQQKKTIDEQKQAIDDLQKKQEQATNEKIANLQKENEALTAQQQKDLARYKEAELQTQMMLTLQKQAAEEEAKVREEQEAKAAQKAKEKAEKAAQKAQTKADDKELAKAYGSYGRDFTAVLNANSIQEFDTAVAHLTETERLFWDARLKNINNPYDIYRLNTDVYSQENLPKDYSKSTEAQVEGLKKRQMQIAEFTSTLISEAEKQEAAFEKMDVLYKIDTEHPANGRASFIQKSLIDEGQTRTYVTAIEEVTASLQRMREIIQSMKDGTFDFGNIDALRELFELRQNLTSQMSTMKDADKAYKEAQGQVEAESVKKTEQYKTVLTGLEKQIEKIQTASKTLINPDSEYKTELESAKELLATIQIMIEELNTNPLQFMGKDGDKNAKVIQSTIDGFKEGIGQFQEDFQSQQGIQGRINTYFTSYKGAYTSFFREIKDSFKSQALGELQNEIDRTFKTFEDSIINLNRATGLNQGEFLNKYLDTNGGKASAIQIEQQQKVRNAIAESYRGLITDISNELTKVQDQMSNIFGKDFLEGDFLAQFEKNFTAGLGSADDFTKFQNNAESAKNSLIELQKIQQQMANGELDLTQLAPDELKDRIQEIVKLFTDFNKNYKLVADNAKEFTFADIGDIEKQKAAITQFLKSNRGISSEARGHLQSYFNQLQQGISQADLTKLTDGWHQVADAEQAAGRTGATFMSELQTRFRSLSAYLLSFVTFYRVIGVFKDGINIIHELDDALTEMQKVSDESLSSLKEYQKGTFATANEIGTIASQLQQSTADWLRLGEDLQNASQSAQTANILFNVSEFENINDATTALVAMSAAYADAEKDIDKMDIVDKLNLIGNNYAIATDELATALQDGAATLQTAGKQHCQNL